MSTVMRHSEEVSGVEYPASSPDPILDTRDSIHTEFPVESP